jgi:hypothetical protein
MSDWCDPIWPGLPKAEQTDEPCGLAPMRRPLAE